MMDTLTVTVGMKSAMYYSYFGLDQPPFRITPDTKLFFPGGNRGVVLDALVYAVVNGEGIVKVVGEVGSGKTTLCRMLEQELPDNVEIIYLANPSLSPDNILQAIAHELKLSTTNESSRLDVMHALQNYLLSKHSENRRVVMFVEEAQSMPIETLEEMRLLSNLETAQEKLLQIVLFGQPELDESLAKTQIRQLKDRITYSFYLSPFNAEQVRDYVNSRMRASGYKGVELFSKSAVKLLTDHSQGLLRRINVLADKALLAAYASNAITVSTKHVRLAVRDSGFENPRSIYLNYAKWAGAGLAIVLLGLMLYYRGYLQGSTLSDVNPEKSASTSTDTGTNTILQPTAPISDRLPDIEKQNLNTIVAEPSQQSVQAAKVELLNSSTTPEKAGSALVAPQTGKAVILPVGQGEDSIPPVTGSGTPLRAESKPSNEVKIQVIAPNNSR